MFNTHVMYDKMQGLPIIIEFYLVLRSLFSFLYCSVRMLKRDTIDTVYKLSTSGWPVIPRTNVVFFASNRFKITLW